MNDQTNAGSVMNVSAATLAALNTKTVEQQTLEVLVRIEELVREGLSIYATKPSHKMKTGPR